MNRKLDNFTDVLSDEICDSQPLSLSFDEVRCLNIDKNSETDSNIGNVQVKERKESQRPARGTGQYNKFRSVEEIDEKYKNVFSYPYFNLVQSKVIDDALYSDKSMVVCAPTGSGKTVIFEMAIVHLLMEIEDKQRSGDFKIIYMAPVKALCTERLTEWYPKFTKLGLHCIEVTGDTDVDFYQLSPYKIIITTPEKWDMLTRRWREHRQLVQHVKLLLIDEVHVLNDAARGPVLEAVVSRMKTIESSAQSLHRIEALQKQYQGDGTSTINDDPPKIRFVAVSATVGNPEDVASWLGSEKAPAVFYKFGDECRPVKLRRVVEGYPCSDGASIFKFDIILSYKLWPIIQKYHNGKPTLIFCNTRKSVILTAETLSREITINFNPEQKAKLTALASTMKNKKLQSLILSGVGCHHAGLLFEERTNIEHAFRNRDLPILITTTTLAMGVNLPAHLVIVKNTQQYVNGAYQEYSISTILQMVGRAGRPQFDTDATAVIMTRLADKPRYQALVGGSEPLQSYLHKRLAENLNSEAALGTVGDVAQCVQWLRSTFLFVRAARDPRRYLGLPHAAPHHQISKKIEELCVKAMNGLASSGLITMDEASCIESTEAGRLMSIFYLDLETMKHIMKVNGSETLEQLLWIVCESHELSDMHLRVDERRYLNALNRNQSAATIRFPMKGKITTRQMKLYCVIQAILGCLPISDPSLNQEAMKIMRIADRVCKCLFAYVTSLNLISSKPKYYSVIFNSVILSKCVACHLWENSPYVARQLKGIGPTFSTLLATAGKVNFMLLEESHPRDLERIMNKGPPAGNVLRKQVSLLPKYQLVMTPMDQNTVSIRLDLLNCNYLLENIDQLTAGNGHKSYIIVGDSENHILLLTSFNDTNLINIYNGSMKYEITRLHNFEHKVFAHCISSTFAGIDVQTEYVFTSLEQYPRTVEEKTKTPIQRQTTITDTFKERKRKNTLDIEITQSKEKKKRENLLIEKFKNLKESFGKTSNQLKYDLHKTTKMSHEILKDINPTIKPVLQINTDSFDNEIQDSNTNIDIPNIDEIFTDDMVEEEIQNDELMNDDKINDILAEIENEITHGTKPLDKPSNYQKSLPQNYVPSSKNVGASLTKRRLGKCNAVKSNYNFIDLLERNTDLNDDVEIREDGSTGFSENIKGNIDNYLCNLQNKPSTTDSVLSTLIYSPKKVNKDSINSTTILDIPDYRQNSLKPHEIKAITEKNDISIKTDAEVIENSQNCNPKINISTCIQNQTSNENNRIESLIEGTNNDNSSEEAAVELPEVIFNKTDNNLKITENDLSTEKEGGEDFEKEFNSALKYITNIENSISCKESPLIPMNMCEKYEASPVMHDTSSSSSDIKHDTNIQTPSLDYNVYEKAQNEFTKEHSSNKAIIPLPKMPQDFCKASELLGQRQNNMLVYNPYSQIAKYRNDSGTTENTPIQSLKSNPSSILDARESIDTSEPNEQIKKYSFSATKIDVVTNEKPDHIMHVIRKLRVDYDITEIPKRDNATSGIKISAGVDPIDVKEYNNLVPQSYQINLNNKINRETVTENIDGEVANSNQIATISQHNIVQNNKIDDAVNEITYDQGKQFPTVENNKLTDKLSAPNKEEETIHPKKTIRSILEKYSDIMKNGKSNDENHITVTSETKNSQGISQNHVKNIKSKRPFSIRDIETLNTNLSKEIIQTSSQNPCYSVTQSAVRRQEKELNPIPLSLEPPSRHFKIENNQSFKVHKTNEINEILPIPNVVYDDLTINDNIESTVTSDFKIDNSMFNPKTLLQHFNNDIEESIDILPPPPEFCNNGDDLNPSQNFDFNVPIDAYEPIEWKSINNVLSDSLLEKDDYHVQLTPSKEIEVWNLSQDKRSENNEEPFQSIYEPRTSIQSYSQSYAPSSIGINRHDKLKAFTLPTKDKLKRKM